MHKIDPFKLESKQAVEYSLSILYSFGSKKTHIDISILYSFPVSVSFYIEFCWPLPCFHCHLPWIHLTHFKDTNYTWATRSTLFAICYIEFFYLPVFYVVCYHIHTFFESIVSNAYTFIYFVSSTKLPYIYTNNKQWAIWKLKLKLQHMSLRWILV